MMTVPGRDTSTSARWASPTDGRTWPQPPGAPPGTMAPTGRTHCWMRTAWSWTRSASATTARCGTPPDPAQDHPTGGPSPGNAEREPPEGDSRSVFRSTGSDADLDPGEALDAQARAGDDLGHRELVVLGIRLVEQHDLLEEARQPALDDLGQRRLRLALVLRGLGDDLALTLDDVGRDLVAGEVARVGERDVLRDAAR